MATRTNMRTHHLIQWKNRNGAIEFITTRMIQGESFQNAFLEMKRVSKKMGFIRKSSSFDIVLPGTVTQLKNDCIKRLRKVEENESA